jgi:GDP/UDP-N,N'-diacetylbacillosamine 2-epimerase (hydrolysing)
MNKKICIITGTRSEYGLLKNVIIKLKSNPYFNIKLVATGSHLSKLHGYTIDYIKQDVIVDYELNMLLSNDSNISIGKSLGIEMIGLSEYFGNNKFDAVMILGDRYEMLSVATIATIFQIKIIHLCGGDISEGAYDDNIRHAISQLSDVHFVTCQESKKMVESFGKNNVYLVGNPGLEDLLNFYPNKKIHENYIMFVYHPETKNLNEMDKDLNVIKDIFNYILKLNQKLIVIGSNADNQNNKIRELYQSFNNKICYYESTDRHNYLSLAYHCNLFMGNSSSGLYEIPFFKKYIINIGNRQKNRRNINNVINIECKFDNIKKSIDEYLGKHGDNEGCYPVLKSSRLIEDILISVL